MHEVTLAEVYDADFGRRTDDLPTWTAALAAAYANGQHGVPSVLDVGCGIGRASRLLAAAGAHVAGIDPDRLVRGRALSAGLAAVVSARAAEIAPADLRSELDAQGYECSSWGFGLVMAAYSVLWLLPDHENALTWMRALARSSALGPSCGGIVACEVFAPKLPDGRHERFDAVANLNGPGGDPWLRRTVYEVDGLDGITRIERWYGPRRGEWTAHLEERLHWRSRLGLEELARAVGLRPMVGDACVLEPGSHGAWPVARGHMLLVGRVG